jgi:outer membrane biosynthesis protein TonB
MKGPSLQKTTAFSAILHITVFLLTFLIVRQNNRIIMPSPYTVQLVSPEKVMKKGRSSAGPSRTRIVSKKAFKAKAAKPVLSKKPSLAMSRKKRKEESIDDAINKLKTKKQSQKKKIQTLALSHQLSVRGRSGKTGNAQVPGRPTDETTAKGSLFDSYYQTLTAEIWQEWIYPDIGNNNLETVILIKIMRDGTIQVQGVEKKSSNMLFDRSALKALAKASPVSPPPYEMELGIRFYP